MSPGRQGCCCCSFDADLGAWPDPELPWPHRMHHVQASLRRCLRQSCAQRPPPDAWQHWTEAACRQVSTRAERTAEKDESVGALLEQTCRPAAPLTLVALCLLNTRPDAGRASSGVRGDGLVSRFYKTVAVVRAPQVRPPRTASLACPASIARHAHCRLTRCCYLRRPQGDGWQLTLDGRTLRSPAKAPLVFPTHALALAVAAEWEWQDATNIRPFTMPLMARFEEPMCVVSTLPDALHAHPPPPPHRACAAPPSTASPRPGGRR